MIAVGITRYTEENVARIIELQPDAVVLGDLTCQKRMFPYGGAEISEMLHRFKVAGIQGIYQSPMYATDRIFSNVTEEIAYYHTRFQLDAVIVQDVGLASVLQKRFRDLKLIWGRMGHARTPTTNLSTIAFYRSVGVTGFECQNVTEANKIRELGFLPYYLVGRPVYTTINRECYYKYEHDIYDDDCGCGCLRRERMILPAAEPIETTIDGYILGFKNIYTEEMIENATGFNDIIIYADTAAEAEQYAKKVRGDGVEGKCDM